MKIKTEPWETHKETIKIVDQLLFLEQVAFFGILAQTILTTTKQPLLWITLLLLGSTIPLRISLKKWKKKNTTTN